MCNVGLKWGEEYDTWQIVFQNKWKSQHQRVNSNVTVNAWNQKLVMSVVIFVTDTHRLKLIKTKGLVGHTLTGYIANGSD